MDGRLRISGDLAVKLAIAAAAGLALWYLAGRAKAGIAAPFQAAADALQGAWESAKGGAATFVHGGQQAVDAMPPLTPAGAVTSAVDFVSWELDGLRRHLPTSNDVDVQISDIQGA
jgi:hypothetical protein